MTGPAFIVLFLSLTVWPLSYPNEKYNFTYDDGDTPWENHIPSEINTTCETVLQETRYLQGLVCAGDSTDSGKQPYRKIKPICLEGRGAKMVIPRGYPHDDYYVFISQEKGGLFEQEHMARREQLQYYDKSSKLGTKYFLAPFEGYEIPTCFPTETAQYLPLWKKLFLKRNRMSEAYFAEHIRVVATTIGMMEWEGKPDRRFSVQYYYHVGWAHVKLQDAISINQDYEKVEELINEILTREDIYMPEVWLRNDKFGITVFISRVASTAGIASRNEIEQAVFKASPKLFIDINRHLKLNSEGELILRTFGVENEAENKCLEATVYLKDASTTKVKPSPCWIE